MHGVAMKKTEVYLQCILLRILYLLFSHLNFIRSCKLIYSFLRADICYSSLESDITAWLLGN